MQFSRPLIFRYTTAIARRRKELLNATVAEIEALGKLCIPFACDARKEEDVQLMFDQVEEQYGPVEVCVFNIGANISYSIRETTGEFSFNKLLDVVFPCVLYIYNTLTISTHLIR